MIAPFLDAAAIRATTFVRHIEIHDTLGSTNDRAAELARETNIALPALVVARLQTAGRGREQKTWWSDEGALTFSLLLDTTVWGIGQREWPQISLISAAAVADALRPRVPDADVTIKPPNDVLIDGRKVSGILLESPGGAAPAKDRLIVGVGINVNNSWRHASPEAGACGTALCDLASGPHDCQAILVHFLGVFAEKLQSPRVADAN